MVVVLNSVVLAKLVVGVGIAVNVVKDYILKKIMLVSKIKGNHTTKKTRLSLRKI